MTWWMTVNIDEEFKQMCPHCNRILKSGRYAGIVALSDHSLGWLLSTEKILCCEDNHLALLISNSAEACGAEIRAIANDKGPFGYAPLPEETEMKIRKKRRMPWERN
jgi:hypothetical protein